jgi:hypothetical protein
MRRNGALACLLFLAVSVCGLGQDQAQRPSVIASLRFDSDAIGECLAAVTAFRIRATGEPRERLTITCQGKQITRFETGGNLVDWKADNVHGDRLFARWERGTGGELTVFRITTLNSASKPIFEKGEVYVPEIVDSPDVVLVYSGVRFVGALKTPTQTDVYRWDGNQYNLEKSWIWDERMRYEDRFCVLDAISLNCPATPKKR